MYLIREIMNCKPGKVRPMVERFVKMAKIMEAGGMGKVRVFTDVSGAPYWTVIAEFEAESLDAAMSMEMEEDVAKEMEGVMGDYHELVDGGRREIYKLES